MCGSSLQRGVSHLTLEKPVGLGLERHCFQSWFHVSAVWLSSWTTPVLAVQWEQWPLTVLLSEGGCCDHQIRSGRLKTLKCGESWKYRVGTLFFYAVEGSVTEWKIIRLGWEGAPNHDFEMQLSICDPGKQPISSPSPIFLTKNKVRIPTLPYNNMHVYSCSVAQSSCSPPGSSVHGIIPKRILEWLATFFSRGSSQPMDKTEAFCISCVCTGVFITVTPGKPI